jgi:DNA uptake protein ComE-like DNA-binding protein
MYELAVPFFPGQQKLQNKIDHLRAKIQAKKAEAAASIAAEIVQKTHRSLATAPILQLPTPADSDEVDEPEVRQRAPKHLAGHDEDEDYEMDELHGDEHDESFSYQTPKAKKSKSKPRSKATLQIFKDSSDSLSAEGQTPRTRHLLDIVNSRDVALIQGLAGVGKKKANDLVEFLALQDGDEGGNLLTLEQLMRAPGMGSKTVEKAYGGIGAALVV